MVVIPKVVWVVTFDNQKVVTVTTQIWYHNLRYNPDNLKVVNR